MSGPTAVEQLGRQLMGVVGFRSTMVPTSVGPVHVYSAEGTGSRPPLVMFHGLASSALHWMPMLLRLRKHVRRVIAIDLPGHGFSYRPEVLDARDLRLGVLEALDEVHAEPAVVIGNSLGGAAAFRYLRARPERVLGGVLFSPAGAPMTDEELAAVRSLFNVEAHADAVAFVQRLHGRPVGIKAHVMAPLLRRSLADPSVRQFLDTLGHDSYFSAEEIQTVPRPLHVVWGLNERILPMAARDFWRANLPAHGAIAEPELVGHNAFLDDPRFAVNQILAFYDGLRPDPR